MNNSAELLEAVRTLAPRIAECAAAAERERKLSDALVQDMGAAGLFHMLAPRSLGGNELHPGDFLRIIEEIAIADASAAWITMIGATSSLSTAYIGPDAARLLFGDGPGRMASGVVAPRGKAVSVDGGYRISGRWAFASGCRHSHSIGLSCMVEGGGLAPIFAVVPMLEVQVIDTWDVSGLRATGSHDVAVSDIFVPAGHAYALGFARPLYDSPLYEYSLMGLLSVAVAAVALGIGRGALDDFKELSGARTPTGRRKVLAEWNVAQVDYAKAEAALRSGRAFLVEAIEGVWHAIERGGSPTDEQRALVRLASTVAVEGAVRAVDIAFDLSGGSAIYSSSVIQRRFRDIHTLTAHVMVGKSSLEVAGRSLLGLAVPPGFL